MFVSESRPHRLMIAALIRALAAMLKGMNEIYNGDPGYARGYAEEMIDISKKLEE